MAFRRGFPTGLAYVCVLAASCGWPGGLARASAAQEETPPPVETSPVENDKPAASKDTQEEEPLNIEEILFGGTPGVSQRIEEEQASANNRFSLITHKPTYIMPITWNFKANDASFQEYNAPIKPLEMKLQLSVKVPVWEDPVGEQSRLSFGYTQQAWWQAYNESTETVSRPFRETNHEPELMLDMLSDFKFLGFTNRVIRFGLSHQSNGKVEPYSRSWNRVYVEFLIERGGFAISFKPWYRLPELDAEDDNPDITDYLGHAELKIGWKRSENLYTLMLRNNLESGANRGAIEVSWSFPLGEHAGGYVQIFSGYGESLIDYNRSVTRLGFGVQLSDWL